MKHSSRPTLEEIAQVKVEGRQQPGWLRSRFMGWPWPRKGISALPGFIFACCPATRHPRVAARPAQHPRRRDPKLAESAIQEIGKGGATHALR